MQVVDDYGTWEVNSNVRILITPSQKWIDEHLPSLNDIKQTKIQEIDQAYQAEINSTFTSSATGTVLIYDFSQSSQNLWRDLFKAIEKNLIPDTSFPIDITLADGTTVPHTKAQLEQVEADIAMWKFPLYQKYQKLVTSTIPNASTIDEINAIVW